MTALSVCHIQCNLVNLFAIFIKFLQSHVKTKHVAILENLSHGFYKQKLENLSPCINVCSKERFII